METNQELELVQQVSPEVMYLQDKAQIDIQISTAKAFPRNIQRAINNALAIVTLDVETAQTCNYALPRGGKTITGPSVHLAKILAQNWGNMRIDSRIVGIDDRHVTSESVCWDLENNLAIKAQVKRSIMTRNGRMNDDMITVTGNAANAISLRNAVLSTIPRGVVDKVYNTAMRKITGDLSDKDKLISKRKQVFDGFKDTYEVSEKEVLAIIGKSAIEHVNADDILVLIGLAQSIKDGDTTVEMAFKTINGKPKDDTHKNSQAKEQDRMSQLIDDAKDIKDLEMHRASVMELFPDLVDKLDQKIEQLKAAKK